MPESQLDWQPIASRPKPLSRWPSYLPLLLALALRMGTDVTADISYVVLAGYAIFGLPHLIRALLLSWLFTMLSPGLVPDAALGAVGRYLVLFASAVSVLIHLRVRRQRMDRMATLTLLLGLGIVAHALLFSVMVDVSVLKAVSWTMAMAVCIAAWCGLRPREHWELTTQVLVGLTGVLIVSLPLVLLPLGYLRNGTGFQGILNHPQAFGPTIALLWAWATGRLLGEDRPAWWLLAVTGLAVVAVFLSEARTAGLAMALAVATAVLLGPSISGRPILRMAPGLRSPRVWGLFLAAIVGALVMSATFSELIQYYLTKSGRAGVDGLWNAYEVSRGRQMDAMLENIGRQLWSGIGFGVDSEPELMVVSRDPVFGLPLGAATEKGVAPIMIVEELGVFGAVFVAAWLLKIFKWAARGGLHSLAVSLTVLFVNFGEATLFSPGGFGLLSIIMLSWAYSVGRQRAGSKRD